jgi:hypothetical protein
MKILFEDYTFSAVTKEITFNTASTIGLSQLLLITNVTTNQIIYNFANPSTGGTIVNNVLTLDFDSTSMSNTDSLQIFLDNLDTPASNEMLESIENQTELLRRMVKLLEPIARQDVNGRQAIRVEAFDPQVIANQSQTYHSGVISAVNLLNNAESTFNLQSRIAYTALRQHLDFS